MATAADTPPYVLQVGDEFEIRVFNVPELDETVRIRPDGKVSVMLVDEIPAAGMTPAEIDALLTERYAEYFLDPKVTVIVRTFANSKIFVGGEVARPGLMPLTGKMTTMGAILEAGGFLDTGKMSSVIVLRDAGRGVPLVMRLNLKDVLSGRMPDVALRSFDVVYVPKKAIARADLFVRQYIRELLPVATNANFSYIVGDERDIAVTP